MAATAPSRVFISYARKDGAVLAQRLQVDLKERGFDPWLDTERLKGGATWTKEIEDALDRADCALVLLTNGSYVSEICRSEQLRALRKGTRVVPIKAQTDTDIPLHLEVRNYRDFSDSTQYGSLFELLLEDICGDVSATLPERYRETRVRYLTAPPRVANYLKRPEALRTLRDALFAEDHRQPIALTALAGMGGIGKTVLAKALTDDEVVQRAFPDGIVWITAGKERKRDFIEEMREVAKALGDDLNGYDTALACENQYRTTIAQKAALIVVDDVWSKADIEPLFAESPRSRFLFTTRDASIGRHVAAREHRANLLDDEQARELLALWADTSVHMLPTTADQIIAECGRLPLALSVIGAMLRGADEQFWTATLILLRNADFSAIEDQLPEGQQSFFKAVEVSFLSLKPEMQERYKELAVLLEDMTASPSILQMLWNVDSYEASRFSRLLTDRSLALFDDASKGITLHYLQLDYVRAQFRDREALNLIHGAIRLSAHVIDRDPDQFASQMVGRLLLHYGLSEVKQFAERTAQGASKQWLRPQHALLHPPGTALVRTLQGHAGPVLGVALSGDGRCALSASSDNTLKVWDVETGREIRTLVGHSDPVRGVALSDDGRYAVSAGQDHMLKLWDVKTGRELRSLLGHTDIVVDVALREDGRLAVSASLDRTLKVWDLETGCELRTLLGHTDQVSGVALSKDGRLAVSASQDQTLKIWDVESGREIRTLHGHADGVQAVALSKDGVHAVSASIDKTLKVWNVWTGHELLTLRGHRDGIGGVAFSGDGRRAVSSSWDDTLKVWNAEKWREIRDLHLRNEYITETALSGDGRRAVSASSNNTLKVWDVEAGRNIPSPHCHATAVEGVAFSGNGLRAISASSDHTLKVWDVDTGRELRTLLGHESYVLAVAMSADGTRAVSAAGDWTVKVWDVERGREIRTLYGHTNVVGNVALSADGGLAVSASSDDTLKVWKVKTGHEIRTLRGHEAVVTGVALSGDGRCAVSASWDRTLKVWDLKTGRELRTLRGHEGMINQVALSRDGRIAVSASWDHTLKVWDLETGRETRTLYGHTDRVNDVSLSEDGRRVVSVSWDHTLKVWDVEKGEVTATFTCDRGINCCAFVCDRFSAGDHGGFVHFLRFAEPKSRK